MNLSFKNRIALHYMIATAIIVAIIFSIVFIVVKETMYNNIDRDLTFEVSKHSGEIKLLNNTIKFSNKAEWEEIEHREIQINPVFIQIMDANGKVMDKSPNLKNDQLSFKDVNKFGTHFNAFLKDKTIRQIQKPIESKGEIKGYLIAAMSLESSIMVLNKLRNVLILSYLILLSVLYFISRYLAGRSIIPIKNITNTTNRITKNNLNERVELPIYKDELYDLSSGINKLLIRIENAIERERQFTSDASHELRTPLSSLRGTLEVLIRKPREHEEYKEKITYSLTEIDKMTETIEQLLVLARLDSSSNKLNFNETVLLPTLVDDILLRNNKDITSKNLSIHLKTDTTKDLLVKKYYANLILENIINNAIKYSKDNASINISISTSKDRLICSIKDEGIGIKSEDISNIFNHFYRSDALDHKDILGNGLGLSIAQKSAQAINATIKVESSINKGSVFTIIF
ncbi:sensor histidine kinase [Yeosuana marina]|uniref:sensor histidine kinase n=1 Tax=Yeosuana marina TaxID=1565536 RepID=UPI00142233FC|nr:HAMP domain-containing sensor histidine kinase [Yeosuana marina]